MDRNTYPEALAAFYIDTGADHKRPTKKAKKKFWRRFLPSLRAFTLGELVVVIVIIGILASISVAGFSFAADRAQSFSAKTSAQSVARQVAAMYTFDTSQKLGDIFDEAHARGDFVDLNVFLVDINGNQVDSAGDTSITADWDAFFSAGAQVRVCNAANWSADISPVGVLSGSLQPSKTWYATDGVKGCDGPLIDGALPAAPSLSAYPGDTLVSATISGVLASDEVSDLEYSTDGGTTWTSVGLAQTFMLTGLQNDVPVSIVVRAENILGHGPVSNTVTVTPFVPQWIQLGVPTAFSGTDGMVSGLGFGFEARLSADGTRFVAGGNDHTHGGDRHGLYIYDLDATSGTWQLSSDRIPSDEYAAMALDISGDGTTIVGASHYTNTVEIWDEMSDGTWASVAKFSCADLTPYCSGARPEFGYRARISDDGSTVAVLSQYDMILLRRDGASFEHMFNIGLDYWGGEGLLGMALSADGETVILGSPNNGALVLEHEGLDTLVSMAPYFRHPDGDTSIFRIHRGYLQVHGSIDMAHPCCWSSSFHSEQVDISNDGSRIAVGRLGQDVKVYDRGVSAWELEVTLAPSTSSKSSFAYAVALSGDGASVVASRPSVATSFVFEDSGVTWEPVHDSISTSSGETVGLSDDGETLLLAHDGDGFAWDGWSTGGAITVFTDPY